MTRPHPPLSQFRALAFYGLSTLWTLVLGVAYMTLFLLPQRYMQNCGAFYCRGLLVLLRLTIGLSHEVRGLQNLPQAPYILAAKHQSAWETLALPTIVPRPSIVLKRSLYRIPVFGWYLWAAGMIGIDRKAGAKALRRMLVDARRAVAAQRPLLIFPEGTRTPPGTRNRFHIGITALYEHLKLPVVPVALNSGIYWPRDSLRKWPGRIVVEFLPAIPPDLPRAEMTALLQAAINDGSDRLLAEANASIPTLESR